MLETGPSTMSRWEGTDSNYIISMVCCYWWLAATRIDVYLTNICCTSWNRLLWVISLLKKNHQNMKILTSSTREFGCNVSTRIPDSGKHVFFLTKENMSKRQKLVVSNTCYFLPYLGKISNLTDIFQMGWNHQPGKTCLQGGFQQKWLHAWAFLYAPQTWNMKIHWANFNVQGPHNCF